MISKIGSNRKKIFLLVLLVSVTLCLGTVGSAFAAVNVTFTTNGAKGNYIPGSSLMVFGKVDNEGIGVPGTSTFIEADINGNNIFYGPVKTDGNGYFKTGFNIPISSIVGQTLNITINNDQKQEFVIKDRNQILYDQSEDPFKLAGFTAVGYLEGQPVKEILSGTSELGLVFTKNVNYFKNNNAPEELQYISTIDKNEDCFILYEAGNRVPISVNLLNRGGDEATPYTDIENGTIQSTIGKRIINIKPINGLKTDTQYSLLVKKALASNSSIPLESDITVYYKTAKAETETIVGGGGGGGGPIGIPDSAKVPVAARSIPISGGTISETGVSVVIPADAVTSQIKINVEKLVDTANLPINSNSKIFSDVVEIVKDKQGNFNKPVTITLTFDKSKADTKKYDLSICYLNETENRWIALDNVEVDMVAGKVSGKTKHFTKFAVIATEKTAVKEEQKKPGESGKVVNLSDIQGHWAQKNIAELVASGAIGGYPDNTFKPDQGITRAEFAAILAKALKLEQKTGKVFGDTANHWAKDSIATAAAHGIVSGYNDTAFGPDDFITREQMAVMIVKAAKLGEVKEIKLFGDSNKVSEWARNAVATASKNKVINGYPDNTFRPQNNATRAEAATVILTTLKQAAFK